MNNSGAILEKKGLGIFATGLSGNNLKIIAIVAMTVDHLAWTFFPGYTTDPLPIFMHVIGRLTAPIMMFFIVEGYYYTHDVKKYIQRMLIFALVSHFAYALMFNKPFIPFANGTPFDQTSVMLAFAMGLIGLYIYYHEGLKNWQKHALIWVCILVAFIADWSSPAALAIIYMGRNRGNFKKQMIMLMFWITLYAIVYAIALDLIYGILQLLVCLAIPLLYAYNGKRSNKAQTSEVSKKIMKYLFYVYYPAHLAILGLVRIFVLS